MLSVHPVQNIVGIYSQGPHVFHLVAMKVIYLLPLHPPCSRMQPSHTEGNGVPTVEKTTGAHAKAATNERIRGQ